MMFLVWYKPETWLSGSAEGVMGAILSAIRTICFWLVSIIYKLIVDVYNLFEKLCNSRILGSELLSEMANRIGLVLGITMFFYIVFSFIQMLVDPEKIANKENGAVAIGKKAILVVIMLGVSTWFFEATYRIQSTIIDSDAISKLILPYTVADGDKDKFGNLLSRLLIESFYQLDEDTIPSDPDADDKRNVCGIYTDAFLKDVYEKNKYDQGYMCLNESIKVVRNANVNQSEEDEVFLIDFNGLLAIVVGAFVVYTLLIYCFKVGVRMIQLAFLEVISPMAIISYMSPKKDNMFSKWWKLYFATYIDVFIRIAIINFVIFLIFTVSPYNNANAGFIFWDSLGYISEGERVFFLVVIILSLLTFAKKAPDLLKELLPAGASKLGFGMSMKDIVGLNAGIGMVTGTATGAAVGLIGGIAGGKGLSRLTGAAGGLLGGAFRGGKAGVGAKGFGKAITTASSNQAKVNLARAQRIASGSTLGERVGDATRGMFGIQSGYAGLNQELSMSSEIKSTLEKEDIIQHIQEVRQSYIQQQAQLGNVVDPDVLKQFDDAKKDALRQMYEASYRSNSVSATTVSVSITDSAGHSIMNLNENYDSNQGIYNQIHNNEKRAGKTLSSWSEYKSDNNELKRKIAAKTKSSK